MNKYPFPISLLLILIVVAVVGLIFVALRKLADIHSLKAGQKQKVVLLPMGLLLGWLLLMAILAVSGFFQHFQTLPPRFALGLIPALLAIVVLSSSSRVRRFVFAAPESWLIAYQAYRIPLEA